MSQGLFLDIDDLHFPAWQQRGACKGHDPDIFFPEGKGGTCQQAKAICRRCPVQVECLEWALQRKERYGIWGGKSYRERRKMRPAV